MNAHDILADVKRAMAGVDGDTRTPIISPEAAAEIQRILPDPSGLVGVFSGMPVVVSSYMPRNKFALIDLQAARNRIESMLHDGAGMWFVAWESKAQRRRRVKRELRDAIAARRLDKALQKCGRL